MGSGERAAAWLGTWAVISTSACPGCTAREEGHRSALGEDARGAEPQRVATESAAARLDVIRRRFSLTSARSSTLDPPVLDPLVPAPRRAPVVGVGVAERLEHAPDGRWRVIVSEAARRATSRTASVELPSRAAGEVAIEDDATKVAVRFSLEGARDAPLEFVDGVALYRGAVDRGRADLVQRAHAEGAEDFVVFDARPALEELAYRVDVTRVAGVRLVADTLEFLDREGAPRLRVAPPWVFDARGEVRRASLALEGCAYDIDPRGPWLRPVTPAGAPSCRLRVTWTGVTYPAVVDPAWTGTGSMALSRVLHGCVALPSGKALVVGGESVSSAGYVSSAELFDEATRSFAATGSLAQGRASFTATLLSSGKVLVAGGTSGDVLSGAELFDGGAFVATGAMTQPRMRHSATLLTNGKVLVAGGYGGAAALSSAELFDGDGAFASTGAMTGARYFHSATLIASTGQVLVAGGQIAPSSALATVELFDGSFAFAPAGTLSSPRVFHAASVLGPSKLLITGGWNGGFALATTDIFDAAKGLRVGPTMATSRYDHVAVATSVLGWTLIAGGIGRTTGGFADADQSAAELYVNGGVDGVFTSTHDMIVRRRGHAAVRLASGKVLITGGTSYSHQLSSAELFDFVSAGGTCSIAAECSGGATCRQGICCAAACSEPCRRCQVGTGACEPIRDADDPSDCTGTKSCNAAGTCLAKNGQPATAGSSCASGLAADGVCCDAACDAPCDACNLEGKLGTCTVLPVAAPGTPSCSPFLCRGEARCPTVCTTDAECANGYACASGTCALKQAHCSDDRTISYSAGGAEHRCEPFTCRPETGLCPAACADELDCAPGLSCASSGQCVAPSSASVEECGCETPGARLRGATGWIALAITAALGAAARRRRGSSTSTARSRTPGRCDRS